MLNFPLDAPLLLRKRRALVRELRGRTALTPLRVAVLGGATTQEISCWLELFLLDRGIDPQLHQSEFNRYFEDTVLDPDNLRAFAPEIVYLHLSSRDLVPSLSPNTTQAAFEAVIDSRVTHVRTVCDAIWQVAACQIILNTLETPPLRPLGSFDAVSFGGSSHFVHRLNLEMAALARSLPRIVLHDAASLAATSAHRWHSPDRWFSYKIPTSTPADIEFGHSLAALVGAMLGRSRKCLVLDLDNTLWGGVIGDDGPDRIAIGNETPRGEAFTAFQRYCRALRDRGILLAVCSKNEEATAKLGFSHPDSVLTLADFSAFKANWNPKSENIVQIAAELNLGLDSFVFIDDNPAERHLVAEQLPAVAVPNVGNDPSQYASILDAARYFETVSLSAEDLARAALYAANASRESRAASFANYGEYLDSLNMVAEIDAFQGVYIDRIVQLTNKTNQFNLTTRRYTRAEIDAICADRSYVTLYGRLSDTFGDNGLVSVVVGRRHDDDVEIDLWLMSCRVLKRDMEKAMLDVLAAQARAAGARRLVGTYIVTDRNAMVANHYESLGFTLLSRDGTARSTWALDLSTANIPLNRHIQVVQHAEHS